MRSGARLLVPSEAVRSTVQLPIRLTAIVAAGALTLAVQSTGQAACSRVQADTGLRRIVLGVPPPDILLIMSSLVIFAGAIIVTATRGRLGLKRPESDTDLNSEG